MPVEILSPRQHHLSGAIYVWALALILFMPLSLSCHYLLCRTYCTTNKTCMNAQFDPECLKIIIDRKTVYVSLYKIIIDIRHFCPASYRHLTTSLMKVLCMIAEQQLIQHVL